MQQMITSPIAKFYQEDNDGTRHYTVDEHNLQWLCNCTAAILQQDIKMCGQDPAIEMIKANMARVVDCVSLINQD